MKKVICAVAALAAGVACAEITSANIVGYQTKDIEQGWSLQTPTFQTIGLEGMSIQDIIPEGEKVAGGAEIYMMILKTDRKTKASFGWSTIEDDDEEADGWYDLSTGSYANYKFSAGDSFMLYAPYALSFKMAGQVKSSASTVDMSAKGWYLIGNPNPTAVDLQSLVPAGNNVAGGAEIYFMVLKTDRKTKVSFGWSTIEDDDEEADGWYNLSTGAYADYSIEPGDAVMFYAPYAMTITFPSPIK